MTLIVVLIVLLVIFGGGYGVYRSGPNMYAGGFGSLLVTLLLLYLVFHYLLHIV